MEKIRAQIKPQDLIIERPYLSEVFNVLRDAKKKWPPDMHLRVDSVWVSCRLKTFPSEGYAGIPANLKSINAEVSHRKSLLQCVDSYDLLPFSKERLKA